MVDAGEHLRAGHRPADRNRHGARGAQVVESADDAGQPIGLGCGQPGDDFFAVHWAPPPENTRRVPTGLILISGPSAVRVFVFCSVRPTRRRMLLAAGAASPWPDLLVAGAEPPRTPTVRWPFSTAPHRLFCSRPGRGPARRRRLPPSGCSCSVALGPLDRRRILLGGVRLRCFSISSCLLGVRLPGSARGVPRNPVAVVAGSSEFLRPPPHKPATGCQWRAFWWQSPLVARFPRCPEVVEGVGVLALRQCARVSRIAWTTASGRSQAMAECPASSRRRTSARGSAAARSV